jgi:phosphatidylserine decarboxylase
MVGKVKVEFDSLTTNVKGAPSELREYSDSPDGGRAPRFSAGAEWGRFEFGSTLVVLISGDSGELDIQPVGTKVKMGARIGTLRGVTA